MLSYLKKFIHSFVLVHRLFYFTLRSLKSKMMWKYRCILYFLFKWLSSCSNTIYQKFHLSSNHMKYSFNHRTNVLEHMLIILCFLFYSIVSLYSYADFNCVNCKFSLHILISNGLSYFFSLFLEIS